MSAPDGTVFETASRAVPVPESWRGAAVFSGKGAGEEIRAAIIWAQRQVSEDLMSTGPSRMKIWWETSDLAAPGPGHRAWNPQAGVPADARWLVCRGEAW